MGTHASKCGPGGMGAGGWAEELVLRRGMNKAVCLQVSADSDAWRMHICQGKSGEYLLFLQSQ